MTAFRATVLPGQSTRKLWSTCWRQRCQQTSQHTHDIHDIGLICADEAGCDLPLLVNVLHHTHTLQRVPGYQLMQRQQQQGGCADMQRQGNRTDLERRRRRGKEGNHTSGCHGSSYLVCQCESGLGERPETLHLKLHLTHGRVKAGAASHTNQCF